METEKGKLPENAHAFYRSQTHDLYCDGERHYLVSPGGGKNVFDAGICFCPDKPAPKPEVT